MLLSLALVAFCAPARADDLSTLSDVMYVGQLADCINSARAIRNHPGSYETNPIIRPFTHGSTAEFCAAPFAADLIGGTIGRRLPKWIKLAGTVLQIGSNAWGIELTNRHTGR